MDRDYKKKTSDLSCSRMPERSTRHKQYDMDTMGDPDLPKLATK